MADLVARTGRHQQRYESGYRLVSGCIPYRYSAADDDCNGNYKQKIEVLMITKENKRGLLFPKGGWETDETKEEAAIREALEEAGVRGEIKGRLGTWDFKSKGERNEFNPEGLCRAEMFALCVTEQLDSWPEQNERQRQWLSIAEADRQCRHPWMCAALNACIDAVSPSQSAVPEKIALLSSPTRNNLDRL